MIAQKTTPSNKFLFLSSAIVFLVVLSYGFFLATKRPIWGDEIHTLGSIMQKEYDSTIKVGYWEILLGKIDYESNNAPMFYVIHRSILDIFNLKYVNGLDLETVPYSRIILRINSVFFGALAVTLFFMYFTKHYSIWAGFYAVVLTLSSHLFLLYWAEGRPYMMWESLTAAEILLFLLLMRHGYQAHYWRMLVVVNILIVSTSVFSFPGLFILWRYVLGNGKFS